MFQEEIYRKIDNYFGEHKHNKNVIYWTMFENADWKGNIKVISASSSTCRFSDWKYEMGLKTDGLKTNLNIITVIIQQKCLLNDQKDFYF